MTDSCRKVTDLVNWRKMNSRAIANERYMNYNCQRDNDRSCAHVFCLSRTLSFKDVLEFSTTGKEKLDVEKKAFVA
jgi:hypothetical protein